MTEPPTKSPWAVALDKLAGVVIDAIDQGAAEAKRKASAPPPNVVPLRPVETADERIAATLHLLDAMTADHVITADAAREIARSLRGDIAA